MPRDEDIAWKFVERLKGKKWRCRYCGKESNGQVTRVKSHLGKVKGKGIDICPDVPDDVRDQMLCLLKEAEEGSRQSNHQSSTEWLLPNMLVPGQAQNFHQDVPFTQPSLELGGPGGVADMANFTDQVTSNQQSLQEYNQSSTMPSAQNKQVTSSSSQMGLRGFLGGDLPIYSPGWSILCNSSFENFESREVIVNTSDEIRMDEPHNSTAGSSLQNGSSLDVNSTKRLQDCSQPCVAEVVPGRGNISPTNPVQHPDQLHSRCDKEDGNNIHSFALRTPMDMDPLIASHHTSDSCNIEATAIDLQVPKVATNAIGPSSSRELYMNEGAPMASHPNTGNYFAENRALKKKLEALNAREASIRDELEFAESLSLNKPRKEVVNWLASVEKLTEAGSEHCLPSPRQVDILMQEAEDFRRQSKGLFKVRETKFSKFLEGKVVGQTFQRHTAKILEYLEGNQVSQLGIYGMGGVGKTTIMKHIYNRLLEKANYYKVLWITVSQDFNTKRLQDDIWNELNMRKLEEKDVGKRAAMLSDCLTKAAKAGKSTIILDDLWEHFDLEEVGIPIISDGLKLVLTTRSFKVCCEMRCQEKIRIEPLPYEEAKSLFLEKLESEEALDLETEAIMDSIVEECAGLPLGVITMARSMRGVTDVFEWRDSLVKLQESNMGQTEMEKVLMILKFSYDRLGDPHVQQCLLSCALYPEDERIDKFELIEFFIDQGLFVGLDRREKQYDRGLTILTKLENVCLLEAHENKMKMHDLIRDMALHIMGVTSMVKAGEGLTRIPPEEYWTDALEKVSLMENDIGEFPFDMSPNCPNLSTLLFNWSLSNVVVPDSFFKKLWGLEFLNLSGCGLIELPNSISDLINLRALLLRHCYKLRHIPYVGKLASLRRLDAKGCECLGEIEGLEMLVNLRYLDLSETFIERLPKGTLGCLLKLQYLNVGAPNEEDITKLVALETLECYFQDADDFNKCARVIGQSNARCYYLIVDPFESFYFMGARDDAPFLNLDRTVVIVGWSHAIVSVGGECAGIFIMIPRDVQKLTLSNCDGTTNLAGMGPLKCLVEIEIEGGENLQVLCDRQDEEVIDIHDSPATTLSPPLFPSLRFLKITECPKLKCLFGYGIKFSLPNLQEIDISDCKEMVGIMATVTSPPPCPNPAFPSLEKISITCCYKMKRVMESEWLPHYPNLREITVTFCGIMEEIIGGPPPNMTVEEISLELLDVRDCHEMRMLLSHEWLIHLRNLREIHVEHCRGMVEMISGAGQSQEGSMISEAGQSQEGSIMTPVNNASIRSSISLPKLTHLHLRDLPQLKSICEVSVTCNSIEDIRVYECPELKGIPLQLRLRDIEDLPYIWVEDEEKWKTLMWDHPDAQAIFKPYLRKVEISGFTTAIGNELIDIIASLLKLKGWSFSVYSDATLNSGLLQNYLQSKGIFSDVTFEASLAA